MSSDKYVVTAAFYQEYKETFITAAGVREEEGGGLQSCGFLFLTPITSYLSGKRQTSILCNTFEISYFFLFFFHSFVSLMSLPSLLPFP